jgi:hypothetical protein
MYRFQANRKKIIEEAKGYGVTIVVIDNGSLHGLLQFSGEFQGSESVRRSLKRKIETYNKHSRKGF